MKCPNCHAELTKDKYKQSVCFKCVSCSGVCIGIGPMRRLCGNQKFLNILWQTARNGYSHSGRACPHCDRAMRTVTLPLDGVPIELDVCSKGNVIWFDPGELTRMPEAEAEPNPDDDLPQEAKELLALKHAQMEGDRIDSELSSYERNSRWSGGGVGRGDFSDIFCNVSGGKYAIIAMVGIAFIWVLIKAVECVSDYRRLRPGGKKSGNWGEDVSDELEPETEQEEPHKKPEPKLKSSDGSSKSYSDDYYKMD